MNIMDGLYDITGMIDKNSVGLFYPQHPRFASHQARIESFDDPQWRQANCPLSAEQLADAGFYYYGGFEGVMDAVKCFYCDAGVCLFEKGDIALQEHRRFNPNCAFVKKLLKKNFHSEWQSSYDAANASVIEWMSGILVVSFISEQDSVSINVLRNTLHRRFLESGKPFSGVDELKSAYLKMFEKTTKHVTIPLSDNVPAGSVASDDCNICCDGERNTVLLPCGHVVGCLMCCEKLVGRRCPYCRQKVISTSKIYLI